jgi:LuxR family transcriptional regulator, quorum-sensing system regulator BjaR1
MTGDLFDPGRAAFDFVDEIEGLRHQCDVIGRLDLELARFGFHAWLITGLPTAGERIEPLMLLNGWPPGWTELYTRQNLVRDDPVVAHCFRSRAPFEWRDAPYDPLVHPQAREVMDRATDFRMNCGFCVPIHTAEGFQAVVTMAGECVDLGGRAKPALHLMALYSYAKAVELSRPGKAPATNRLTNREREVLRWTAAGKTAWEISQILGIAESTVTAHVKAAAVKLDTPNRTATVVAALRRGEITL